MNGQNSTKFYLRFDIDNILVGMALHQFTQIPNRVMAHESCQNFLCSLSRELVNGIVQNFAYALMLTRSRLTICNIYKTVMTLSYVRGFFLPYNGPGQGPRVCLLYSDV